MIIAQVTGFEAGEFVHVIADAHIYDRHVDMVRSLIEKDPFEAPKLWINPEVKDFYAFTKDDVSIEGYHYHDFNEKIPVAI
jgi:thymidylate synthase